MPIISLRKKVRSGTIHKVKICSLDFLRIGVYTKNYSGTMAVIQMLDYISVQQAEREQDKGVTMKQILVVEDDVMLNSGLCYNLELDEYKAVSAHDAATALQKIKNESIDLMILDVNLPDGDGFELCKKIRIARDIPVIFLTARDLEADVMKGYDLGADDYITKPFNINIFRKKVAAVLKRSGEPTNQNLYLCGDFVIDFDKLAASIKGTPVVFTPTEYKILKIFTSNSNALLTRQLLLEKLYDVDANFVDEHALTVNINRLRNKIETGDKKYIKTVYGMGYLWAGDKE